MAFTLVINPGSSSKKFALYKDTTCILDAYIERSDDGFEMCSIIGGVQQRCDLIDKKEYKNSLRNFLLLAKQSEHEIAPESIGRVAIRIVAPGTFFTAHRQITKEYIAHLEKSSVLAPLHIPHVLQEIAVVQEFLPQAELLGISDSAFHSTKPEVAHVYSIPKADAETLDIYRFGYHGLSVSSVVRKYAKLIGRKSEKMIVCHIGSGVSVTALKNEKSIDTTMGYAPGSGLVMGSRAGDIDAGALLVLMQQKHMKPNDAQVYLQSNGGLKALGGESDLRLLLEGRARGDKQATTAVDAFIYHLQKTIGGYVAILGGLDTLILTATASERSPALRSLLLSSLAVLGIELDVSKSDGCINRDGVISKTESSVTVAVIKTAEADEILHQSLTI